MPVQTVAPNTSSFNGSTCEERIPASQVDALDMEGFVRIACGHSAFQLLWAGAELDLFSLLANQGALTRKQIAFHIGLDDQPARVLLHGLTALRLLKKEDEHYRNAPIAERLLVRGRPGNFLSILGWQHHIIYKGLVDFVPSLKENRNLGLRHFPGEGDSLYERLRGHPELETIFQDAMSTLSGHANCEMAAHLDLSDTKRLLDIGGGDGTNCINLVKRHPRLKATVFDSKSICSRAQKKISKADLSERVHTFTGDCFRDRFPDDCDAMLLAHMLTIWSPEKNTILLRKCFGALPENGRLLIFNMVSWDDETGPLVNALGSPYFQGIATGEGMLYCEKDIRAWLAAAGFRFVERVPLPLEHGLFIATK